MENKTLLRILYESKKLIPIRVPSDFSGAALEQALCDLKCSLDNFRLFVDDSIYLEALRQVHDYLISKESKELAIDVVSIHEDLRADEWVITYKDKVLFSPGA